MTLLYFVRHCKPDNTNYDDRERPLTAEGMEDSSSCEVHKSTYLFFLHPY